MSLFLILCNSFSNVPLGYSSQSPETPSAALSINAVPDKLGIIEESFSGTAGKKIIYIQDAHDSLEAQRNIARLIRRFVEKDSVETVFEEGYDGPVPSDRYFGIIQDAELKQKVSYLLMDRLRLGGAEYAHINRKKEFKLIGADSVELLLREVAAYRKTAERKKETSRDIEALSHEIEQMANQYFPKPLKEWIRLKHRFDKDEIEILEYLRRTLPLRGKNFINDYPALALILAPISEVNAEKLRAVDGKVFFQELDRLENDLAAKYLKNERDGKIFKFHKYLELVKRLQDIELKSSEYEALKEQLKGFDTRAIAEFIHASNRRALVLSKAWEENILQAVSFYEISRERDGAVEKRMGEFLENSGEKIAVLVYGGFHKERIKEILREKQISYEIIMPAITGHDEEHQSLYKNMMSQGYKPLKAPVLSRAARYPPIYVDALSMSFDDSADVIRRLAAAVENVPSARSEARTHEVDPRERFDFVKKRLVQEAQGLLDFYAQHQVPGTAPELSQSDAGKNNIIILVLGSPSVETYVRAAENIRKWKEQYGKKSELKIIASTGVGRGTARLISNTQNFYDGRDQVAASNFRKLREERGAKLTEAEVIKFILADFGVIDEIILEDASINTWANMTESMKVIKSIISDFKDKKPLKIQITTDGFHRLRALLQALYIFKDQKWQITAEPLYVPDLASMSHEDLVNYLEFLLGYPKELDGSRMPISEGERIHNYGLGAQLNQNEPSLLPFDFSMTPWPFERQRKIQELFKEYLLTYASTRGEVRANLEEIADHPVWQRIVTGKKGWLGEAHVAVRLLKNYPELFEDAARRAGHNSFKEYLDSSKNPEDTAERLGNFLNSKIPNWMWHHEIDYAPEIDVRDLRFSEFFRYPAHEAWFYKAVLERVKRQKAAGDKRPISIDLVGPAYFQEPVTLLAIIKTAYEQAGATLEDVPLKLNVFDLDKNVFELFERGGLVYQKEVIDEQMKTAREQLGEMEGDFKGPLLAAWSEIEKNMAYFLPSLTKPESLTQISGLPRPSENPWLRAITTSVDYKKAEGDAPDYSFVNFVLFHLESFGVLDAVQRRVPAGGVLFAEPALSQPGFDRYPASLVPGLKLASILTPVPRSETRAVYLYNGMDGAPAEETADYRALLTAEKEGGDTWASMTLDRLSLYRHEDSTENLYSAFNRMFEFLMMNLNPTSKELLDAADIWHGAIASGMLYPDSDGAYFMKKGLYSYSSGTYVHDGVQKGTKFYEWLFSEEALKMQKDQPFRFYALLFDTLRREKFYQDANARLGALLLAYYSIRDGRGYLPLTKDNLISLNRIAKEKGADGLEAYLVQTRAEGKWVQTNLSQVWPSALLNELYRNHKNKNVSLNELEGSKKIHPDLKSAMARLEKAGLVEKIEIDKTEFYRLRYPDIKSIQISGIMNTRMNIRGENIAVFRSEIPFTETEWLQIQQRVKELVEENPVWDMVQQMDDKEKARDLKDYDEGYEESRKALGDPALSSKITVHLAEITARKPVAVWTDAGSGNGIALRNAKALYGKKIRAHGLDILDLEKLSGSDYWTEKDTERRAGRNIYSESNGLDGFQVADVGTAQIPEDTDLLTVAYVLQYSSDPLAAIINLYNQLKPGATLAIKVSSNYASKMNDPLNSYLFRIGEFLHASGDQVKVGYRESFYSGAQLTFENYRTDPIHKLVYPLTLFVRKTNDARIETNLVPREVEKILDGVIIDYSLREGSEEAFIMRTAAKSEVRIDLQTAANHPGWKILTSPSTTLEGRDHLMARLLAAYPEVLEAAAKKAGKISFLQLLNDLEAGKTDRAPFEAALESELPGWMWYYEPDFPKIIDVDDIRFSEFFRYPRQYAWFYKNIIERLKRQKSEKDSTPIRVDLVGPAYFQEPVTLLALIKTAYQKAGVTVEQVPFEFHIFDLRKDIFDLQKKGGIVFDKAVIDSQAGNFQSELAKAKGAFKNDIDRDWQDIQSNLFRILVPLTAPGSLTEIYQLPAQSSDPWVSAMVFDSDYTQGGTKNSADYSFMNYVLMHAGWSNSALKSAINRRTAENGIIFADPDKPELLGFIRHPETVEYGLMSESISHPDKKRSEARAEELLSTVRSEVRAAKDELLRVREEAVLEKASVSGQAADYAQVTIDEIDRILEILERIPEDAVDADTKRWIATFLPTEEGDKLLRMQDLGVFQKIMRGAPDEDLSPFPIRAWHMLRVQRFFRALTAGNFDYYLKRLPASTSAEVRKKYLENLEALKSVYDKLSEQDKVKIWLEIKFHDTGYSEEKGTGVGHEPRGAVIAKRFIEEELKITGSIPEDVADVINRHMGIGYAYLGEKRIGKVLGELDELKVRFLLLHVAADAPAAINNGMSFSPDQLDKTVSWLDPAKRLDTIDHNDQYRLEQLARLHVMAPKLTEEEIERLNAAVTRIFGTDEAMLRGLLRSEADITDGVALLFWQLSANDPSYSRYVKFLKILLYVSELLGGKDTEIRSEITKSYPVSRVEAVKIITAKVEKLLDAVPDNVSLEDVRARLGAFADGQTSDLFGIPIKRVGKEAILIVSQFYDEAVSAPASKSEVRAEVDPRKVESVLAEVAALAAERGIPFTEKTKIALLIAGKKGRSAGDKKYDFLFRELYPEASGSQPIDAARISYWAETEAELEELLEIIRVSPRFVGAVITTPWKTAAAKYVDSTSPLSGSLKSVNNIIKTSDGKLIGDAVDGRSFVQAYSRESGGFSGKQIMLLGAGGAGRQVAEELAPLSPAALNFAVKPSNAAEAELFAESLRSRYPGLIVTVTELGSFRFNEVIAENNILVNATGQDMPLEVSQNLPLGLLAVELSNLSPITPFLVHAKERGARIANGTEMALQNSLIHASRWIEQMTGKTLDLETLAGPLRRYNHDVLGLPTAEEAYAARSEVRQTPAVEAAVINVRAVMEESKDIPAAIFFPYQEIVKSGSTLREGLLALSVLTKGSRLKLIIYGADSSDLSLRELGAQGVKISPMDFKAAYGLYGEKQNGRNVNVSTNADELRRQLGEIPGAGMNHVLAQEQGDIWAAYLRAIIDPSQPIQGMDNSEGYYKVSGDFLRSQLQKYQASLVILASA